MSLTDLCLHYRWLFSYKFCECMTADALTDRVNAIRKLSQRKAGQSSAVGAHHGPSRNLEHYPRRYSPSTIDTPHI